MRVRFPSSPPLPLSRSTYAISMTPVAFCLEELLPLHPSAPSYNTASLLIRTALVVSTVAVALLIPFFGAFRQSCIPGVCQPLHRRPHRGAYGRAL